MKLLSIGTNAKTVKGDKLGEYLTAILYLAPEDISGKNLCPWSTAGCRQSCLYSAGRGKFSNVQQARIRKSRLLIDSREEFFGTLYDDICKLEVKCKKESVKPCVRLNGTSDVTWENMKFYYKGKISNIFDHFPHIQFYDYTKAPIEARKNVPSNYNLVHSRANEAQKPSLLKCLHAGRNVAVVFEKEELPSHYWGYPVWNGDTNDLRFLDPSPYIVGLKAKGSAKFDQSGFVVKI